MTLILLCFVLPLSYSNISKKARITKQITMYLKDGNSHMDDKTAKMISESIYEVSSRHGLDYRLVLALMKIESNFKFDAISSMGARGLLQVKPSVAKYIAQDAGIQWDGHKTLDEPDSNIKIGVFFLSQLLKDFPSTHLALKAYNMGPTRVRQRGFKNTQTLRGFPGLVMSEYIKNASTFPEP